MLADIQRVYDVALHERQGPVNFKDPGLFDKVGSGYAAVCCNSSDRLLAFVMITATAVSVISVEPSASVCILRYGQLLLTSCLLAVYPCARRHATWP